MPLESCMLVLDNSEYMRNGDYTPTRFQAQAQAVSAVFSAKTDSNPESAVGLMTMAGKSPCLLVTPTNDIGKLLSALNKANIGGVSDMTTAIQVAQLALKHRENKNQRQRVVVFVGSPLDDSKDELVKLGKRLRKNNVLIDIVTFGDEGMGNDDKLNALVEAAGGGESHLVSVPPGPHLLSDVIMQSPILFDPERAGTGGGGGDGEEGMMGMDDFETNDPELAMAIRLSMQEAQERAERDRAATTNTASEVAAIAEEPHEPTNPEQGKQSGLDEAMTAPLSNANDKTIAEAPGDDHDDEYMDDDEDDEAMLARAMALSRGEDPEADITMDYDEDDEDEEAAIARAIAMSLEENKDGKDKPSS
ncbi:hypothetical protein CcaverHIS002_0402720 [Cutaneotrichosporon cavernicola]|uniref:VWFA domain-containing protein n=1 Tax=Cutaneotrichosporon cavernicola TaxID=279322 RepID=A0AA48L3V7_9TREE|nr:uncharacterized protein CcaverHIS019_0402680 [Cutaneotrichosporon cavernicola]BEI83668.1 hypothetical protein CcaverHIS002_0402720 [Cutaneotrichosporon cavernicola]BEI91448.1 hypothetical protein CcaverHIS019_0402680 [Cutaneotrichosporon cavernicola]BEI99222.1 hypothetical protein CcaverHIS631_0402650 [Cutaneotrichosporon cavernicola]BEJ06999.1 hypothetical protein CcaverHIS641_0402680 [Cutaneotrichosporon cavernicola]